MVVIVVLLVVTARTIGCAFQIVGVEAPEVQVDFNKALTSTETRLQTHHAEHTDNNGVLRFSGDLTIHILKPGSSKSPYLRNVPLIMSIPIWFTELTINKDCWRIHEGVLESCPTWTTSPASSTKPGASSDPTL